MDFTFIIIIVFPIFRQPLYSPFYLSLHYFTHFSPTIIFSILPIIALFYPFFANHYILHFTCHCIVLPIFRLSLYSPFYLSLHCFTHFSPTIMFSILPIITLFYPLYSPFYLSLHGSTHFFAYYYILHFNYHCIVLLIALFYPFFRLLLYSPFYLSLHCFTHFSLFCIVNLSFVCPVISPSFSHLVFFSYFLLLYPFFSLVAFSHIVQFNHFFLTVLLPVLLLSLNFLLLSLLFPPSHSSFFILSYAFANSQQKLSILYSLYSPSFPSLLFISNIIFFLFLFPTLPFLLFFPYLIMFLLFPFFLLHFPSFLYSAIVSSCSFYAPVSSILTSYLLFPFLFHSLLFLLFLLFPSTPV